VIKASFFVTFIAFIALSHSNMNFYVPTLQKKRYNHKEWKWNWKNANKLMAKVSHDKI